jgi:hypothetical protein
MRHPWLSISGLSHAVVLSALLALASCAGAIAERSSRDYADAWNAHDIDGVLSAYDDGVVVHSPMGTTIQGKDQLRAFCENLFKMGTRLELIDIKTEPGDDGRLRIHGRWNFTDAQTRVLLTDSIVEGRKVVESTWSFEGAPASPATGRSGMHM